MTENMKRFLELVSGSEELRERLEAWNRLTGTEAEDRVIALAAENGIHLTKEDFTDNREIDDDELDAVAGGMYCFCVLAGGGTGSENEGFTSQTCVCMACGDGEGYKPNLQNPQAINKVPRCQCVVGGQGDDCER